MPGKMRQQQLYVFTNGELVGTLKRESAHNLSFYYCDDWLANPNNSAISLSMPLSERRYGGDVVTNYFDNLLPDNEAIRERIQTRFQLESKKCFDLLSSIGADCVGALQLLTQPKLVNVKSIHYDLLNEHDIAVLLKHYQSAPLGMERNSHFRISIAGAQEKTALLWHDEHWCLPKNHTPTSHIIKLPIGYIAHTGIDLSDSVENEWLCSQLLEAFGLKVAKTTMQSFEDVNTLVVERFDRQWQSDNNSGWFKRLMQEDMCQAHGLPNALKYESDGGPGIKQIMALLQGSQNANNDRISFMKSVFIFWVLGAIDGHAKNFSIQLSANNRFALSPLYDVISAYPIVEKRQLEKKSLKMAMALQGKNRHYNWDKIQLRHWYSMADFCKLPHAIMNSIIEDVFENIDKVIEGVENRLPKNFPQHIALPIFKGMRHVRDRVR